MIKSVKIFVELVPGAFKSCLTTSLYLSFFVLTLINKLPILGCIKETYKNSKISRPFVLQKGGLSIFGPNFGLKIISNEPKIPLFFVFQGDQIFCDPSDCLPD
jgi:hypothetical protein